jgi:hypothetical protein
MKLLSVQTGIRPQGALGVLSAHNPFVTVDTGESGCAFLPLHLSLTQLMTSIMSKG